MVYLTDTDTIKDVILDLQETDILWLDTEVADYKTKKPRLSLIQVLAYPDCFDGNRTYIFDVLDNHEVLDLFIQQIMNNNKIKKVFHNAKYDLKFLEKKLAKNIFCTLEFAKKIPYYLLPVKKYSLKALTEHLTDFNELNKEEQGSDWGIRPLTSEQLNYAKMDCVYLAQVYQQLMQLQLKFPKDPEQEDINSLLSRYQEIEAKWLYLDSEKQDLEKRIKEAMLAQNMNENDLFKLNSWQRTIVKSNIQALIQLVEEYQLNLDFEITLTKDIQSQIGDKLNLLETEIDTTTYCNLKPKN
jgi:ribonuclease D